MVDRKAWYHDMFPQFFDLLKYSFSCVYENVYGFITGHRVLVLALLGFFLFVRLVRFFRWLGSR